MVDIHIPQALFAKSTFDENKDIHLGIKSHQLVGKIIFEILVNYLSSLYCIDNFIRKHHINWKTNFSLLI